MRRLLIPVAALTAIAQTPPHRPDSRLIEINVIARDKSGPIAGLTADDFKVFDKGKEQKIAWFRVNSRRQPAPAPTLGENLYSNRPDLHKGAPSSVTVVLLDGLNTSPGRQEQARKEVLRLLAGLRSDEAISVYALGTTLRVLREAGAVRGRPDEGRDSADLEKWAFEASTTGAMDLQTRLRATASALDVIANHIGGLPGRKNLVWVSGSYPFTAEHYLAEGPPSYGTQAIAELQNSRGMARANDDPTNVDRMVFQREAAAALQALNYGDVALYPTDAAGLVGPAQSGGVVSRGAATRGTSRSTGDAPANALRVMSEDTGGRTFHSGNDLEKAVRAALDDTDLTYTLAFFPDPKNLDSKYHDLKVQTSRKDIELRYRKGYVASRALEFTDAQRGAEYRDALTTPLASSAIGLMGGWEKGQKPGTITSSVLLTASDVAIQQKGAVWGGDIEVVFSLRSADGKELQSARQGLTLKLDAAKYQAVMAQGISIEKTLEAGPNATELRVLVVDKSTGKVGSLIMPLKF
jgi:VWFA-related protein